MHAGYAEEDGWIPSIGGKPIFSKGIPRLSMQKGTPFLAKTTGRQRRPLLSKNTPSSPSASELLFDSGANPANSSPKTRQAQVLPGKQRGRGSKCRGFPLPQQPPPKKTGLGGGGGNLQDGVDLEARENHGMQSRSPAACVNGGTRGRSRWGGRAVGHSRKGAGGLEQ